MKFYKNPHEIGCYWYDAVQKYGAPNLKWCEQSVCAVVSEPANTFSNIAYFVAAFIIYHWTKESKTEFKYASIAMILMGSGSFYYHMSNFYISQVLDFVGMFLFVFWLLCLSLIRLKFFKFKSAVFFYLLLIIVSILLMHVMYIYHVPFQSLIVLAVLSILSIEIKLYLQAKRKYSLKYLITGFLIIGFGELFSILDLTKTVCTPDNHVVQGHAFWHILSAIGLVVAFKHWLSFENDS